MGEEYQQFVKAIEEDPLDSSLRLVFADWLEEHGMDDEAQEQRRRSTEEWKTAYSWLKEFSVDIGMKDSYVDPEIPFTVDDLISIGTTFADTGESFCQNGNSSAQDEMWYDAKQREFWENWMIVTNRKDVEVSPGNPFRCSC